MPHGPGGKVPRKTLATKAARRTLKRTTDPFFVPKNPFQLSMLKMLDEQKLVDVVFSVCEQESCDNPTTVHAHRCVLQACAPDLFYLCETANSTTVPIAITGVRPEIFVAVVRYLYGEAPSALLEEGESAKELIEAANKFALSSLKVEAEVAYVDCTEIALGNVVDNFYFADTRKCALLKEQVMRFIYVHGTELLGEISFKDGLQSQTLFHDFLAAKAMFGHGDYYASDDENYDSDCDDPSKIRRMPVDALRRKLNDKGMDIDGTREMLVTALEGSYAKSGEKGKRL